MKGDKDDDIQVVRKDGVIEHYGRVLTVLSVSFPSLSHLLSGVENFYNPTFTVRR